MRNLKSLVGEIQYDTSWAIWAQAPFTPESAARYGQTRFNNGGLLDGLEFFADGVACGEAIADWLGDTQRSDAEEWMINEGIEEFIIQKEVEREDETRYAERLSNIEEMERVHSEEEQERDERAYAAAMADEYFYFAERT